MQIDGSHVPASFIFPVWMLKILRFVLASGKGNSIFRSIRPGRINAGSKVSIRFVAMMTCKSMSLKVPFAAARIPGTT